ncbi:MAG: Anaerobic glycerol-3-phosphate dehydrogenase subunit B [Desulfovibrio sp.]
MLEMYEDIMDVAVIGAGLAGLAAGAFAVNKGLSVARLGSTGGLAYTTGYLDMLGIAGHSCEPYLGDPRKSLVGMAKAHTEHPYANISAEDVDAAFAEFLDLLGAAGLPYVADGSNMLALSPMGTVKSTYAVPATMMPGVTAFKAKTPCLLVGFTSLKAFSAKGIAATLKDEWPDITPVTVEFPDMQWAGELYPEAAARSLEVAANREALADSIRPHLGAAKCVGFPAILGVNDTATVHTHMQELLGVAVFEIPTLPPSVCGLRMRESLDDSLRVKGAALFSQRYAFAVRKEGGLFHVDVGEAVLQVTLRARSVILATGRFLSGGLVADRAKGVYEPLMGLAVTAPASREEWHRDDYFDAAGHPVNRAGVRVDAAFRPLAADGTVVDPDLYVAGAILAGQDWIREKSGAGISISSAWKAVNAAMRRIKEGV